MTYLIFGDTFTFPEGSAATNRVYNYAKGFIKNDVNIEILCFNNSYSGNKSGTIEGINYYSAFEQTHRSRWFVKRRWFQLVKYYNSYKIIKAINQMDHVKVIHCYTSLFKTQLFAFILSRLFGAKLVMERGEHPMRNFTGSTLNKIQGKIRLTIEPLLSDGIFCISQFLIDFYLDRGVNKKKLFLSPSTVDNERFQNAYSVPFPFEYILYCGNLSAQKDGIPILIESFSRLAEKYPFVKLVLVGSSDTKQEEDSFKDIVNELNIDERVVFVGQVPRIEVPAYMCHAKILALARPDSIVAEAGFPSKLTEYLATGNPVLVTEVGDIPIYLHDKENAFIALPDNVDSFTGKLDFILSNYEFAKQVGLKGKELSGSVFNYAYQSNRIINYISSL